MKRRALVGEVNIEMHGITGGDDYYVAVDAVDAVTASLKKQVAKGASVDDLKKVARDTLLNLLWDRTKQRPMAVASIIEV